MAAIGWHFLYLMLVILSMAGGSGLNAFGEHMQGELVVLFKLSVSSEEVDSVAHEVGAEVSHRIEETGYFLFVFPDEVEVKAAIDILREKEVVEKVFQNIIFKIPEPVRVPLGKPKMQPELSEASTLPVKDNK